MQRHRHIDDILYVAGRAPVEGQTQYDIMFIAAAVDEDVATQHSVTTFGYRINQPAEYLNCRWTAAPTWTRKGRGGE